MTVQWSAAVRNGMLDTIETVIGVSPKLQVWSGSIPANCAAADSGTKLAEFTLDADWSSAASAGSKAMQKGGAALSTSNAYATTGITNGTASYYRIRDASGTTCHEQGTVGTSGTDMIIDNASIATGQAVNITGYSKTAPGA
jgi:hypothetical protein